MANILGMASECIYAPAWTNYNYRDKISLHGNTDYGEQVDKEDEEKNHSDEHDDTMMTFTTIHHAHFRIQIIFVFFQFSGVTTSTMTLIS